MDDREKSFTYHYSASQQAEIKKIREKYLPREENKMEQLRRLDESTTRRGLIVSLTVGVVSTLILGVGMCCCLVWAGTWFVPGIVIGIAGMAGMASAYPLHTYITKKQREKLAPEILRLTDELLME